MKINDQRTLSNLVIYMYIKMQFKIYFYFPHIHNTTFSSVLPLPCLLANIYVIFNQLPPSMRGTNWNLKLLDFTLNPVTGWCYEDVDWWPAESPSCTREIKQMNLKHFQILIQSLQVSSTVEGDMLINNSKLSTKLNKFTEKIQSYTFSMDSETKNNLKIKLTPTMV